MLGGEDKAHSQEQHLASRNDEADTQQGPGEEAHRSCPLSPDDEQAVADSLLTPPAGSTQLVSSHAPQQEPSQHGAQQEPSKLLLHSAPPVVPASLLAFGFATHAYIPLATIRLVACLCASSRCPALSANYVHTGRAHSAQARRNPRRDRPDRPITYI